MDFSQLLESINHPSDPNQGACELFPVYYKELHNLAHKQLKRAWSVQTIQTTALINEAYLKLHQNQQLELKDKTHFFALCAKAMRQILVNYAEQKNAMKRGGNAQDITFDDAFNEEQLHKGQRLDTLLEIDQALIHLSKIDEQLCLLVELRFFAGLTELDIAEVFDINERTVRRNWQKAKILLAQSLAST